MINPTPTTPITPPNPQQPVPTPQVPPVTQTPTSQIGQRLSPQQTQQLLQQNNYQWKPAQAPTPQPEGFSNGILGQAFNQIKQGFQQTQKGASEGSAPLTGMYDLASGAGQELSGGLGVIFSPVSGLVSALGHIPTGGGKNLGDRLNDVIVNPAANQISNIPALQQLVTKYPGLEQDIPNIMNIGLTMLGGGEKGGEVLDKANTAIDESAAKNLQPEAPKPTAPTPEVTQTQLKSVANDWQKPAEQNTASFNKARAALSIEPGTPQFLAEQGLNPFSHIEDGKYITSDTAETLRDTAGKLSNETLRPSLQLADYTTPKTPIADLSTPALADAKSNYGVTATDSKAIQTRVNTELGDLQEKYPNGMSLENMHDEKITYAKNGGYNQFKSAADNNNAIANRAISQTLGDMVEQKAPPEVPVGDTNKYLSKYYKAADYLDALNGKKAPVSFAQQVARGIAKFGGAKVGGMFGGGVVSEFAGYQLGKALEHMVENLTNPMRDSFLKNLKVTNPEAFQKISQYMGDQATQQATMPRLPSGTDANGVPKVINLSTPDTSKVEMVPAEKVMPTANPKTGRMQKTYSSTPK